MDSRLAVGRAYLCGRGEVAVHLIDLLLEAYRGVRGSLAIEGGRGSLAMMVGRDGG